MKYSVILTLFLSSCVTPYKSNLTALGAFKPNGPSLEQIERGETGQPIPKQRVKVLLNKNGEICDQSDFQCFEVFR